MNKGEYVYIGKLLSIWIVLLFVLSVANAETFLQKKVSDVQICADNTTLIKNQTWMFNTGTLTSFSTDEVCANGCNEMLDVCQESPFIQWTLIFMIIIILTIFIFSFI